MTKVHVSQAKFEPFFGPSLTTLVMDEVTLVALRHAQTGRTMDEAYRRESGRGHAFHSHNITFGRRVAPGDALPKPRLCY